MHEEQADKGEPRGGRCAIVGRPNVGKSTLLNTILGQKLVITTPTPGTTRSAVLGVFTRDDPKTQIAFVDTPGLTRAKSALGRVIEEQAKVGFVGADLVVFMTAVSGGRRPRPEVHPEDKHALAVLERIGLPAILVPNKIDLLGDKRQLLPFIAAYEAEGQFEAVVPTSATEGKNVDALLEEIRTRLPDGLLYEDPDMLTDRPMRFFAAEMVREAVLRHTRQEVPHGCTILIDEYTEERADGLVRIQATIVVEKESHKKIVIGARGSLIKTIGTEARRELEAFLGRKVFLKLWVKAVPGWTARPDKVRELLGEWPE